MFDIVYNTNLGSNYVTTISTTMLIFYLTGPETVSNTNETFFPPTNGLGK